jgi:hypothetical protein
VVIRRTRNPPETAGVRISFGRPRALQGVRRRSRSVAVRADGDRTGRALRRNQVPDRCTLRFHVPGSDGPRSRVPRCETQPAARRPPVHLRPRAPGALLVLGGALLWYLAGRRAGPARRPGGRDARALTVALDRELDGQRSTLRALAGSARLQNGDLAAFHAEAAELARSEDLTVVLRDLGGRQLVNTRVRSGRPCRGRRPRGSRPARSRRARSVVSGLFPDPVAAAPVFAMVLPWNGTASRLPAVLPLPAEARSGRARERDDPGGLDGVLRGRRRDVVARSDRPEEFIGKPAGEPFGKPSPAVAASGAGRTRTARTLTLSPARGCPIGTRSRGAAAPADGPVAAPPVVARGSAAWLCSLSALLAYAYGPAHRARPIRALAKAATPGSGAEPSTLPRRACGQPDDLG